MIRFVHPGSGLFTHPGSRGQKRHRIPDPNPQHCLLVWRSNIGYAVYLIYLLFSSRNISPFINMLVACSRWASTMAMRRSHSLTRVLIFRSVSSDMLESSTLFRSCSSSSSAAICFLYEQGFGSGSGSAWIRINLSFYIRIQEGKNDPQK